MFFFLARSQKVKVSKPRDVHLTSPKYQESFYFLSKSNSLKCRRPEKEIYLLENSLHLVKSNFTLFETLMHIIPKIYHGYLKGHLAKGCFNDPKGRQQFSEVAII